jgi:predicted transcriptional regulator
MRTHIVLPDDLVAGVDELVGKRKRSEFIAEAALERLRRERQLKAIREGAGILDSKNYPHWATPEKVAQWVRDLRDTPSIRRDPLDEVLAGFKRGDRLAKGPPASARASRRAKQPR